MCIKHIKHLNSKAWMICDIYSISNKYLKKLHIRFSWHTILSIWLLFFLFLFLLLHFFFIFSSKETFSTILSFETAPMLYFIHKKPGWSGEGLIEVGDPLTIHHLLSCHVYKQQNVMSQQQTTNIMRSQNQHKTLYSIRHVHC